jgi:flagellar assembly factor FliW
MMPTSLPNSAPLRFETRFGPLEARDPNVVEFPEGIPGFESCRRWILVESEELTPLRCLLAVDGPEPSFLTVDPRLVMPDYAGELGPAAQAKLGAQPGDALLWLGIVTLTDDRKATVNLKAPIVINTSRMLGCQVILDGAMHPVDAPI